MKTILITDDAYEIRNIDEFKKQTDEIKNDTITR